MPAGRPREFDTAKALDDALRVFWRKGYEGTSMPDLTKAMGINRPSLYAAFGNKEKLFRLVLDRYACGPAAFTREALAAPTARGVAEQYLRGAVTLLSDTKNPRGCLVIQGALACGDEADRVKKELIARRKAGEASLCARFEQAQKEGDLPRHADPAALARFISAVVHGMAVQAASGATREELSAIADTALRAWPR